MPIETLFNATLLLLKKRKIFQVDSWYDKDQSKAISLVLSHGLFETYTHPSRKVKNINDNEINLIIKNIKKVLKNSIRQGGSSIKNFSSDDGKKGIFQQYFKVYGKKGEQCSNIDF